MDTVIKKIKTEDTYLIRKEVLRKGIDLPYKFVGDFDDETYHLGAFFNDKQVGIVTLMKSENNNFVDNQYQLRGMATLTEVRGKGIGKQIVNEALSLLRNDGVTTLWCNAREEASSFYKGLGFNMVGESFIVEKVGVHYVMTIDL
ncbi:GNAT family N-acetyltransferase [Tenacibaculum halocynthiae]|uniref:GNAT family N-acetyltransferase n=1 Tax=Tenacibaculum halocynthiae TaxID=1254437 RepID=UPI003D65C70D